LFDVLAAASTMRHMCFKERNMGVMCRECWLGRYDDLSEQAFYIVGGIEEVVQKAEKMAKDMA
jgi:F0F1-type ATP synthase beta subunit